MAKAKKKAKKVKADRFGRTAASRIRTAETVAKDAEQRAAAIKRENVVLRLQNNALMEVLRAHTEQIEQNLKQVAAINGAMLSRARQHQAEGLLRAIADGHDGQAASHRGSTDINDD